MKLTDSTGRTRGVVLCACLLLVGLSGCLSGTRSNQVPAGPLDFTFVNNSGLKLTSIWVSPHDVDDWQENILNGKALRPRNRIQIRFDHQERRPLWDLKIEGQDGRVAEFKNLDLRRISRLTVRLRNGIAIAEAE